MTTLTIDDITPEAIMVRLVNTAKIYRVPLDKAVRLSSLEGLPRDEILLAGVVAGKVARGRPALQAQYDFRDVAIDGDFRLKDIVFERSVGFVSDDTERVGIPYKDLLSNLDVIQRLSDELAFYIGFLYATFSLPDAGLTFHSHPRPYLKLR
ncbi:hypothetical protein ACPRNU_14525 [Chromobacterium vaccinii]|uniref:hypothetical protein n=1 Tax=Chromobacterium vaccinii TaxID=1108595 RepID=UPI003C717FF2